MGKMHYHKNSGINMNQKLIFVTKGSNKNFLKLI